MATDAPPESATPATRVTTGRDVVGVVAGGAFMGAAEIVPGVSGGTIALVFGIYDRLIQALAGGSQALGSLVRGDGRGAWAGLRAINWGFLAALGAGMAASILALTGTLEHLLEAQPIKLSALFFGLVVGSLWLAGRELRAPLDAARWAVVVGVALATFLLLGITPGRIDDPALPLFFAAAAIAICAMILPGISGSFLLLLMGMYEPVIGAVGDRDLVVLATFALGAAAGLAVFSRLLERVLQRHHDVALAALLGLMAGSLRVLWPWPAGPEGVGDAALGAPVSGDLLGVLLAAAGGLVLVVVIARVGDLTVGAREAPR